MIQYQKRDQMANQLLLIWLISKFLSTIKLLASSKLVVSVVKFQKLLKILLVLPTIKNTDRVTLGHFSTELFQTLFSKVVILLLIMDVADTQSGADSSRTKISI